MAREARPEPFPKNSPAAVRGIFGAPGFNVSDELFWGDDRLWDALDWAAGPHDSPGPARPSRGVAISD